MAKDDQNKKPEGAPKGKPDGKPQGRPDGARGKGDAAKKGGPSRKGDAPAADTGPKTPPRLHVLFQEQVRAKVAEKFNLANPMSQPRLEKIVVNINMGRHLEGTKIPPHVKQQVLDTIVKITGQKPVVIKARKSVSNFKLRAGFESSAMVTMRRDRMWHFLDRLINLAAPRIKDFRGLNERAFDGQGNYAMGLTEQGVFPEINMAEAQFTHGMNINMCFRNSNPEKSRYVLELLGMPFRKPEKK
jgi:large subunit ribosomal protein L5